MNCKVLQIFLCILMFTSCITEEENVSFSKTELERLLAADSAKTWYINERLAGAPLEACDMDDQLTFLLNEASEEDITFYYTSGKSFCDGQTDSVIFRGNWSISDSEPADTLLLIIEGDTNKRSIDLVTSQMLELSYLEGTILTKDSYSILP